MNVETRNYAVVLTSANTRVRTAPTTIITTLWNKFSSRHDLAVPTR